MSIIERTMQNVRAHFAANGNYDLIMQDGVTVYTIADDIHGGGDDEVSREVVIDCIREVLDELEPEA